MDFNLVTNPTLLDGKRYVDERGTLLFLNELSLSGFKRFYVIENHSKSFVRAWHGHLKEAKAFIPIHGSFLVGAVSMTDIVYPDKDIEISRTVLDSSIPQALLIPAGFANGLMSLSEGAKLLVLSNATLEESQGDDYRFPYDYWDIWKIENR
jgi:dTDP-4-dehydrorhamnose 3,5-epimerase-like enzyme